MSINIKGQKFLGNDLELIDFIKNDLENLFSKEFNNYFSSKEVAISIGRKIKVHLEKEEKDKNDLLVILNSTDRNLSEQRELIIKNKTIEILEKRKEILNSCKNCNDYIELLKKLEKYYSLKEYSILLDTKFLSVTSQILIFFYKGVYYTSIQADNEKVFTDFLISSKKFQDYSFDFNETKEEKISEKDLSELIEKENVWKSIYALIKVHSEENKNTQIASSYIFDIFKNLTIDEQRKKELLNLVINNI
ncbi:hypothetical protein [Aliarcobacter butzleri]|uniref:hypothetical protein n=1 Tax=Aliarcobacter butzleri TaxID=28197 RepID=UPI00126A3937|nr:hypothetical protein [Aliarcobacter butzleri]